MNCTFMLLAHPGSPGLRAINIKQVSLYLLFVVVAIKAK